MDCKTGEIHIIPYPEAKMRQVESGRPLVPLSDEQVRELEPLGHHQRKNNMRNKPCVCGSGRKFKRCCWSSYA